MNKKIVSALLCGAMILGSAVPAMAGSADGKKIALFGSYGWGDGEWMRNWEEDCKAAGAELACDSVMSNEGPGDAEVKSCEDLGAALA